MKIHRYDYKQFGKALTTFWFSAHGEFLESASKMNEVWYNKFWKPWLNWAPQ